MVVGHLHFTKLSVPMLKPSTHSNGFLLCKGSPLSQVCKCLNQKLKVRTPTPRIAVMGLSRHILETCGKDHLEMKAWESARQLSEAVGFFWRTFWFSLSLVTLLSYRHRLFMCDWVRGRLTSQTRMPTQALEDVELAEEGLLPSTESSSSKFLSEE